jgi:hypothetical protein
MRSKESKLLIVSCPNNQCMSSNDGSGAIITVIAWNSEIEYQDTCSFDCEPNAALYQHFLRQEPIPVLLLVDNGAKWNQELENVYLVSCRIFSNAKGHYIQHYEYELRPDCE